MIWIQPPGTATVGHRLSRRLSRHRRRDISTDAAVARRAWRWSGRSIQPAAGTTSTTSPARPRSGDWYDTIGNNGWRLEEFQHYYGNATFDDAGTSEPRSSCCACIWKSAKAAFSAPLDQAIRFVLDSQYPNGGWPQRFPRVANGGLHGQAGLHRLHHLQRRCRGREHQVPAHGLSDHGRSDARWRASAAP